MHGSSPYSNTDPALTTPRCIACRSRDGDRFERASTLTGRTYTKAGPATRGPVETDVRTDTVALIILLIAIACVAGMCGLVALAIQGALS